MVAIHMYHICIMPRNLSVRQYLPVLTVIAAVIALSPASVWAQNASSTAPTLAPSDSSIVRLADSIPHPAAGVLELRASISQRTLVVLRGDSVLGQYQVAVGLDEYPTPRGEYWIKKIVWNPRWVPPPNADWAKGKTAKEPGSPANPMRLVKIFFKEPDYYIHGTDALESLGDAASHGCLRMDPDQAAAVAKLIMEHGGQPREENWFWRVLHFRREEKTVYLDNPVRLVIEE